MTDIHKRMNAKLFDEKAALEKENAALKKHAELLRSTFQTFLIWAHNLGEATEADQKYIVEMIKMIGQMKWQQNHKDT